MIVVKIELHSAITGNVSEIGRMYIANDGKGTADRGDYKVAVCRRGTDEIPRELFDTDGWSADALKRHPLAARAAEVKNYQRLAYNVWRLIARSVLATFPEEARRLKRDESTLLDEQIMRGLKYLADRASAQGYAGDCSDDEYADARAAEAWLNAASADGP